MNATFFTEIQTKLHTILPNLYVRLYNSQFDDIEDGENYSFPFPCCFIEFVNDEHIKMLGNGVQLYDPLIVRFHIGDLEYDSMDGNLDQNLNIFTLKETIYTTIQRWKSSKSSIFIRTNEIMDTQHNQVSVFLQEYKTTLVDDTMREPVGGISTTITTLDDTIIY
jgi:hypothetical protein